MSTVRSIGVSRNSPCKPYPALFTRMSIDIDLASRLLFRRAAAPERDKIDRLDEDVYPIFAAEIGSELFHRLLPAGRQHEIDLLRRQKISKLEAKSA